MSLILPTVGQEPGPTWATDLNSSLSLVDQHDHTPGNGVAITPAGLSISTDLPFLSNNATALRSVRFTAQGAVLVLPADKGALYEVGLDLYYNDGNGTPIRITQSGGVAGTSGSITGLVAPATATYVPGTPAFVFQSDVNKPASLDGGSLTIRNITTNSKGVTLSAPPALAADYTVTFPATLPASAKFLSIDAAGNIGDTYDVDNSTLEVSGSTIQVKAAGITGTQVTSDINLPGKTVEAAGQMVVVSANTSSFGLMMVRGEVDSAGVKLYGEGFTSSITTTGTYSIAFSVSFGVVPTIVVTCLDTGSIAIPEYVSVTTAGCVIKTRNSGSGLVNRQFSFIAMGERA